MAAQLDKTTAGILVSESESSPKAGETAGSIEDSPVVTEGEEHPVEEKEGAVKK